MESINFSTVSKSYSIGSDINVCVKRTDYAMSQRTESNCLYVEEIKYVGNGKTLYRVHADDVLIGESIYDEYGLYLAYRYK